MVQGSIPRDKNLEPDSSRPLRTTNDLARVHRGTSRVRVG